MTNISDFNNASNYGFYPAFLRLSNLFSDDDQWVAQVKACRSFHGWENAAAMSSSSGAASGGAQTLLEANEIIRKLRKELREKVHTPFKKILIKSG